MMAVLIMCSSLRHFVRRHDHGRVSSLLATHAEAACYRTERSSYRVIAPLIDNDVPPFACGRLDGFHTKYRAMKHEIGFTVIELLVAITILAVLLGVGLPSLQETIRTNRVASTTNDVVAALQIARSEAIRRGENVTVCSSKDQTTCSGTWEDGWVVRNAANPLRVWPALAPGAAITVDGDVVFEPLGNVTDARCFDVQLDGTIRSVEVGASGRVRTDTVACP